MDPQEAVRILKAPGFDMGKSGDGGLHDVLHSLHQDLKVRDAIWVALDHRELEVMAFQPCIGALDDSSNILPQNVRLQWLRDHGWGEFYFYAAWMLWRDGGDLERMRKAAEMCVRHLPGDQRLLWLMTMIEEEARGNPKCHHLKVAPLVLGEDGLVHAFDGFEGAVLLMDADDLDPWTRNDG